MPGSVKSHHSYWVGVISQLGKLITTEKIKSMPSHKKFKAVLPQAAALGFGLLSSVFGIWGQLSSGQICSVVQSFRCNRVAAEVFLHFSLLIISKNSISIWLGGGIFCVVWGPKRVSDKQDVILEYPYIPNRTLELKCSLLFTTKLFVDCLKFKYHWASFPFSC